MRKSAGFGRWLKRLLLIGLIVGAVVLTVAIIAGTIFLDSYRSRAAQFNLEDVKEMPERSAVYDANGDLYSYIHGENRRAVTLEQVSPYFIKALLAREDTRFHEHDGVDYKGIARAAVANIKAGGVKEGASTITQQLARNSFKLTGKTYDRKLLEAMIAKRLENSFSKEQILEFYINRIYFGSGYYGLETASQGYFGKRAAELTLAEGALLAGLIRSPNNLSPINDLEAALKERNSVLKRMVEVGAVSAAEAESASSQLIKVVNRRQMPHQENYAMDAVLRDLSMILSQEQIDHGGLKIFTTLDPELQKTATEALDEELAKIEEQKEWPHPKKSEFAAPEEGEDEEKPTPYLQGALVVVDNRTGGIRAIVGGRDYKHSKYNRAVLSQRQIGSTFKPFIYALAFQRGLLPGTLVSDDKIDPAEFSTITNDWSPENSDGEYGGLMPAEQGLIRSRNTMTVRVGEFAGMSTIRRSAAVLGLKKDVPELPTVFLGAFETTVKDLTSAYSVFPNHGIRRQAHIIARIDDTDDRPIYRGSNTESRALDAESAWMTSQILVGVVERGTAAKAKSLGLKKPAAGKTGTTNDYKDAWFVGYTSSLTCGVWVGFDQPQTIMKKGYGSTLALPVWVRVMQAAPEKEYPAEKFEPASALSSARICSVSGLVATSGCESVGTSYETSLPPSRTPTRTCTLHPEPVPVYATQAFPDASLPLEPAQPAYSDVPPADVVGTPVTQAPPPAATTVDSAPPDTVDVERTENGVILRSRQAPSASAPVDVAPAQRPQGVPAGVPVLRAQPIPEQASAQQAPPEEDWREEEVPVRRAQPVEEEEEISVRRAEPVE